MIDNNNNKDERSIGEKKKKLLQKFGVQIPTNRHPEKLQLWILARINKQCVLKPYLFYKIINTKHLIFFNINISRIPPF